MPTAIHPFADVSLMLCRRLFITTPSRQGRYVGGNNPPLLFNTRALL